MIQQQDERQGVVSWFNKDLGYGFLTSNGGERVFVHHTKIVMNGFRELTEGQSVSFEVVSEPKGLAARNVKIIEEGSK